MNRYPAIVTPRWVAPAAGVLTIVGLGVSIYLTIAHFDASVGYACPTGKTFNCEKVTESDQAYVFGIPVAVLGLAYYAGMIGVQWPALWRSGTPLIRYGRVAYLLGGLGMVAYLIYAEVAIIDAICLWCTVVHVVTFLLFCVTLFGTLLGLPAHLFEAYDDADGDSYGLDVDAVEEHDPRG